MERDDCKLDEIMNKARILETVEYQQKSFDSNQNGEQDNGKAKANETADTSSSEVCKIESKSKSNWHRQSQMNNNNKFNGACGRADLNVTNQMMKNARLVEKNVENVGAKIILHANVSPVFPNKNGQLNANSMRKRTKSKPKLRLKKYQSTWSKKRLNHQMKTFLQSTATPKIISCGVKLETLKLSSLLTLDQSTI